jgi:hypothetical protein
MAAVEHRIRNRNLGAKDNLKSLYKASTASAEQNLAPVDAILSEFVQLKADVRVLLTYYSDEILNTNTNGRLGSEAIKLDRWLIDFENKYSTDEDSNLLISHELLLELGSHKYRALHKVLMGLGGHVKHEQQQVEQNLPNGINECSRDLPSVMHFVKTFLSLLKRCTNAELSQTAEGGADLLQEKERMIESLQLEVNKKNDNIMDLKAAMIAGSSESSRNHAIMRLQERLTSLDSQLVTAAELKDDTDSNLRLALQAKAIAEDQTALVRSQLRTLRKNYDQDVAKLRPMLEDQVRNARTDLCDVQALRSDTALRSARMASLQKQVLDLKDALASARINEHGARTEAAETRIAWAECQKQNAKLSRMQTVIVAAKLNFQELVRSLTKRVDDQEINISQLKPDALESLRKADESELLCDNLRREVAEKGALHASMRAQLMLWKAEAASEHLATKSMRHDLNEILETDSAAFRDDFARISNELATEREISERLNKQLRTAMHRIYELQGQLLNDRTEAEVEVVTEAEVA